MIPKTIHYCWFGHGGYPEIVKKCLASWQKYCPDYQIKRWDESNYNVEKTPFTTEAYQQRKWAFVSDYARLDIIYHEGGIYLDTDVELIRSLDDLLSVPCFVATASDGSGINSGLGFGAEAGHEAVGAMLEEYTGKHLVIDGRMDLTPCPVLNTAPFLREGYDPKVFEKQVVLNALILPPCYFDPINGQTSELHLTDETIGIHRFAGSWQTGLPRLKAVIRTGIGLDTVRKIKKIGRGIRKIAQKRKL